MFNFSNEYLKRLFDAGHIPVLASDHVDCTQTLTLHSTSPRHADLDKLYQESRVFFSQIAAHCLNYWIPCHNPLAFFQIIYERRDELQHPDAFSDIHELLLRVIAGGQTCFGTIMDEPGHVRENMRICDFVLFPKASFSAQSRHSSDNQTDTSDAQAPCPDDDDSA